MALLVTVKAWLVVGGGVGLVNEEWLKVPVWDLCENVGFGRVVKEPVKEDSWRLLRLDEGGGGAE